MKLYLEINKTSVKKSPKYKCYKQLFKFGLNNKY